MRPLLDAELLPTKGSRQGPGKAGERDVLVAEIYAPVCGRAPMNARVVYDSQYGNTERVARTTASQMESLGPVRLISVGDAAASDAVDADLLVIGGPARPRLRSWVASLPITALQGRVAATFDKRLRWPMFLTGSAARSIAKRLQRSGSHLVAPPESVLVVGADGPLAPGEIEWVAAWAKALATLIGANAASRG